MLSVRERQSKSKDEDFTDTSQPVRSTYATVRSCHRLASMRFIDSCRGAFDQSGSSRPQLLAVRRVLTAALQEDPVHRAVTTQVPPLTQRAATIPAVPHRMFPGLAVHPHDSYLRTKVPPPGKARYSNRKSVVRSGIPSGRKSLFQPRFPALHCPKGPCPVPVCRPGQSASRGGCVVTASHVRRGKSGTDFLVDFNTGRTIAPNWPIGWLPRDA